MSKRRKKKRRAILPIPSQTATRGILQPAVVFLVVATVLALGFWWWKVRSADISSASKPLNETSSANAPRAQSKLDFRKLKGRWQRLDGGYLLEIKNVADDGSMEAAYFNPNSIHVAKAEAARDGDAVKVFVELRDVNYPGSTYSLTYDPVSDKLKGVYYQAVEGQRFAVAFVRVK